jgi:hypothetical protein
MVATKLSAPSVFSECVQSSCADERGTNSSMFSDVEHSSFSRDASFDCGLPNDRSALVEKKQQ